MPGWRASYECSSFKTDQLPAGGVSEIAVAGRSNVGKSSLINKLLGARLAHVGATPGKTRSINFFLVERDGAPAFRLVDLPGFGYASRSKSERDQWARLVGAYTAGRENLVLILHLVDFRHGLLKNDIALREWLDGVGIPGLVVFTKGDKISRGRHKSTRNAYIRSGLKSVDMPIITSSKDGTGVGELRLFIESYLAMPD
ncbi:MAG: ribosome biogenesis GTP-binding protein YsxC [Synergistaceae bacterium]|nr:ribosome biogenesis GTP-binding protein YihA/YsxC [Synergistota bacterium]NLM71629.1 ribosome biogenesis GTP-binding protein YsxC [Synergistaceae bacterium]